MGYNIASLYPIVGDRMVQLGRMAKAWRSLGHVNLKNFVYIEAEMPATIDEFYAKVANITHLAAALNDKVPVFATINADLVRAYYDTVYTMKDLKKDVAIIKAAMKTAVRR